VEGELRGAVGIEGWGGGFGGLFGFSVLTGLIFGKKMI
jgi:hypothetical protein